MTDYVLLDEHIPDDSLHTLRKLIDLIVVTRVGNEIAPPFGSSDPDLLAWCVERNAVLISGDRNTMTKFHRDRLLRGESAPGLIILKNDHDFEALQMVALIVQASEPYEVLNCVHFVGK